MKLELTTFDDTRTSLASLHVVVVPKQASKAMPPILTRWDNDLRGVLTRMFAAGDYSGARDESAHFYTPGGRLLLVGTGKSAEDTGRVQVRRAAAVAARRARALGAGGLAFEMPAVFRPRLAARDFAQAAAEGLGQGGWTFEELKKPADDRKAPVKYGYVVVDATGELGEAEAGFRIGEAIGGGQSLARRLQFLPPNQCTPEFLAQTAREIAARHGLQVTVLGPKELVAEGLGAILAVAQGSATEPRLIALEYRGAGDAPPIGLVGKGITFDSGGISIKPAASMEDMKYDMSGAAAVLGAMEALGRIRPAVNVVAVVPTCDNMPSGTAIRPADVVKSHFGKTIEIVNTDAEGRLILADALSWIRRFKPVAVLDAATLTGAALFVTGHQATPIMGNDEALIEEVRRAADRSGERVWPLPMYDEFREQNKSDIADVKNSGGRPAGTITAGWFLREFVDSFAWVHLDVAGTAYTESDRADLPKGPAGVPMRTFVEWVLGRAG